MGDPTPFAPHHEELNENCPDCGKTPITGQFTYLGRARDPQEFRSRLMANGVVDVRIFGQDILCAFVDWDCSSEACRKAKRYDESPVTRLAQRAKP
jgi:hypothetical protein